MTMNERIYLNNDWFFSENWDSAEEFRKVRLPHTCRELPLHYCNEEDYQIVSGYGRKLEIPEKWKGSVLLLTFEGAAHQATVFVNGTEAATHNCGYTAFTVDISDLVKYGESNQIAVRLDSRESLDIPPFGFVIDYMTYGGIYRDVYLDVKPQAYIEDVFIRTEKKSEGTRVLFSEIELGGVLPDNAQGMILRQSIRRHVTGAEADPVERRAGNAGASGFLGFSRDLAVRQAIFPDRRPDRGSGRRTPCIGGCRIDFCGRRDRAGALRESHLPPQTGIYRSLPDPADSVECALTPGKDKAESRLVIKIVRKLRRLEHGAVFFGHLFFQLPLRHGKRSALQKMQILNQEKEPFAGTAKGGDILFPVCMDIAMAQFVIKIPQTQFDVVYLVLPCRRREEVFQFAEQILCCVA